MTKRNFAELSIPARVGVVVGGIIQAAFAFLAFWDLSHRPAADVKGPKLAWVAVIPINWIGPASYFLFGLKR